MSRSFPAWSSDRDPKPRRRLTVAGDLGALWRRRCPDGQRAERRRRERLSWSVLRGRATLAQLLAPFRIETVGRDALVGLVAPFVLAVNEAGRLDQQILALALPRRLRPALRRPSSALSRGRNVVVFSHDPEAGRSVGEFDTTAAELAAQHGVPVVPVGIVGSYRLPDTLQLKLTTRPLVSVRFGSPVRARNRSLEEVTEEIQSRVEHLVGEGTLS